ncbi:uncharacterized mitochondrial protein AtMg00810-like [Ricinus communis]|uniref:uncharacterized mitochondrial protein AtMg00810-like n=1 Tax=Ricinus communis TaxID=3988 RepID=UPI00201A31E8|nr:uncharacterized mitochondrial protein AtMg00810-like [Ricinus communis]
MKDELDALELNNTYTIVPLPVTQKVVGSIHGWSLSQLDINNAFLNGDLYEDALMELPLGYQLQGELAKGHESGLEIARSRFGISICQRKYVLELLEEFGHLGTKPSSIPIEVNHKLAHTDENLLKNPTEYRKLVGKLLHLTLTRPDISYVVHVLTKYMDKPTEVHLQAAFKVLRYLKTASGQGIFMSTNSELKLRSYTYSNWAGYIEIRKSLSSFCIFIGNSLVSWKSKK